MLEHPSFRPKVHMEIRLYCTHMTDDRQLFITGTGLRAGEEDEFPGPDNQSKMRRSCDNAQHIGMPPSPMRTTPDIKDRSGLFAPRAGQAFRDEQRRRSSQYDRGTRLTDP